MARKKKPSRKYTPRSEFRYNNSKRAAGHPHYIFGEKDGFYYSLGLTTHPHPEYPTFSLSKNPDPNSTKKSHVQRNVFVDPCRFYKAKPKFKYWRFDNNDIPIIRHIIKSYKRTLNK